MSKTQSAGSGNPSERRAHRAQPAEDEPHDQRAAAGREAERNSPTFSVSAPNRPPSRMPRPTNTTSVSLDGPLEVAERPARRARRRRSAPASRSRSPRLTTVPGGERNLFAAADELQQRDAAPVLARRARPSVRSATSALRDDHVQRGHGKSSRSRSSTSSPKAGPPASRTWRRAPTTTTSPGAKHVVGRRRRGSPRRAGCAARRRASGANERSTSPTCGRPNAAGMRKARTSHSR